MILRRLIMYDSNRVLVYTIALAISNIFVKFTIILFDQNTFVN